MNLPGCKGCGENVEAEIEAKEESGGQLTQHEQRIKEEGAAAVPFAYGPLSSYNGTFCGFCLRVGVLLVFVVTGLTAFFGRERLATEIVAGVEGWSLLLLFSVLQLGLVLWLGRYPILGAVFGPIVERIAASLGWYITAKAERDYAGESDEEIPVAAQDVDMDEVEWEELDVGEQIPQGTSVDLEVPDNLAGRDEVINRLRDQIETVKERAEYWKTKASARKEMLNERSAELQKRDDELQKKQKSLKQLKNEKNQKEQRLEKKEERVQTLETKLDQLSDFQLATADQQKETRIPIWVPHAEKGGSKVGPYWLVQTVQVQYNRKDWSGSGWHALVVDDKSDPLPGSVPNKITSDEVSRWEEHLLPRPDEVTNPAEYEHMDSPAYDHVNLNQRPLDEYPRVLFHESLSQTREALNEIEESISGVVNSVSLTLAYDTNGNYVPPSYDPRGFESRTEWENLARKRNRLIQSLTAEKRNLTNTIDDLRHALQTTQQELQAESISAEQARKHADEALSSLREKNRNLKETRQALETAEDHAKFHWNNWEQANKALKDEREDRLKEKRAQTDTVKQYESLHDRDELARKLFNAIEVVWPGRNGDRPYDYDAIREGESDHSREDVIRDFYQRADDDEFRALKKRIEQEMQNFAMADGGEDR